ncbi:MAG: hypothetical protein GY862_27920 [Gammaproteobacteria bacterium]|nr:hypothetical protein [Gammaproteobacteria bacterium]
MNMRIIGLVFFVCGTVAAIICAAKLPVPPAVWPDNLQSFALATLSALSGLALFHWSRAARKHKALAKRQFHSIPGKLLVELLQEMQALENDIANLQGPEIVQRAEILLDKFVLPFADRQNEIIAHLGRYDGTAVLTSTARGERLLNRMSSAAGDGCLTEARINCSNALEAFANVGLYCKKQ